MYTYKCTCTCIMYMFVHVQAIHVHVRVHVYACLYNLYMYNNVCLFGLWLGGLLYLNFCFLSHVHVHVNYNQGFI